MSTTLDSSTKAGALLDNVIGANPNIDPHSTQLHPLGMEVKDINGSRFRYVKFGGTVAQYEACTNAFALLAHSTVIATASGTDASQTGINLNGASVSGNYGWIKVGGIGRVKVASSLAAKVVAVPATTAGTLTQLTVTTTDPTLAEVRAAFLSNSGRAILTLTTEGTPTTGQAYVLLCS